MEIRHKSLGLTDEQVIDMYKMMLLARKLDERMWLLNRAGQIPFVVSCQGQEAAQVGAAFALDKDTDYIAPYYRDLGLVLSYGMTAKEVMLGSYAKEEDPSSAGRQMPAHYSKKKNRILTGSSPVTTQVPHAVGVALAAKIANEELVSFVTLGEGSSNQGDFHEGLNFAGVHRLPVITMVQNNGYAISVPVEKQLACEKISDRAIGYGMPGYTIDGNDPLEVYKVVKEARERAISGKGPTLIEAITHRLTAHSSDDNERQYRDPQELEDVKKQDCVHLFQQYLIDIGLLNDENLNQINEELNNIVNEATDYAESAPYAAPHTALHYVYEERGE